MLPGDIQALAPSLPDGELQRLSKERREYLRGKRGRKPRPVTELVVWGPPRHVAEDAWPRERSEEWAREVGAWTRRHFPDSPILDAALHMDEGSPHVHVSMFPRYTDEHGETAYGWRRTCTAATDRIAGREPQRNSGRQRMRGTKSAGTALSTLHDSLHAEVGAKFGLVRGERGSQRKHEAVTVTEATKRHVKDRTLAIKARERELDQREAKITRRSESLDAAVDRVRGVVRDFDEQHARKEAEQARKEADVRAREDVNHNEQERLAAEAKRLAQVKRDLTADRKFLEHGGRAEVERKQRLKAEAELAEYKRIADPLIKAAQPETDAKRKAREALEARIREDEEDERLVRKHKLAQEREQRREARQREQANKRRGVLSLITPQRGKDGGIGRERER